MKRFLLLLTISLLASNTIISKSAQESPELAEATELTKSVDKLVKEDKFDEALPLAKRALQIRERLLPRTDPRVATSIGYLGNVYMAKRDYDNARKTFERLLELQAPGPEDIQVADTYYALGQLYRMRRDYEKALNSYRRSLLIYVRDRETSTDGFERASLGFSCVGYESGNRAILDELAAIKKQFVPAKPLPPVDKVLNGHAVLLAKPEYPVRAREQHLSGTIVVHVEIDEEGKVISAKDVCGGIPYLGEAAVKAALKSRFAPTTVYGVPIKVKGVLQFSFVSQ
jgi:TonB family protein